MTTPRGRQQLSNIETTCEVLLNELQLIWDEVGESNEERDKMLLDIEQECLQVYHRKVDEANRSRTSLHQLLAEIHSQIVALASALGDLPPVSQLENRGCPLKEQLVQLKPILEEMSRKKDERFRVLQDIRFQIQRIQCEICPSAPPMEVPTHEKDLTQRKLEELQTQLQILLKEKGDRLLKVEKYLDAIHELCLVLGCDFFSVVQEVHPSLDESTNTVRDKSISNETIKGLESTIQSLRDEKRRRMQQIQDTAASLLELWNLMDTPLEEQHQFHHVTCNIAAEEHEVVAEGALSMAMIEQATLEVARLEDLKASKMKELVLKKRTDMEELCRKAHIIPDSYAELDNSIKSMESGMVDPEELLTTIEEKIGCIKEEAFSRREIMDKVEKWMGACEEESWLEDYNKDETRYNATRGAHLNLKRAERARAAVNKIPAMVETLIVKTTAWEEERGKPFMYDGVRLLSTIEDYNILRIEKEEERRRQRDQKKLHEQLMNEQETLFGSRQSPNGKTPLKRGVTPSRMNGNSTPANRRMSVGGAMLHESPAIGRMNGATPRPIHAHGDMIHGRDGLSSRRATQTAGQVNRVLLPDENNTTNHGREGPISNVRLIQTPCIVNRVLLHDEDGLSPHGNNLQPRQETDAPTRVPFSPVSAPQQRLNTNTITPRSEESQTASTMVKATNNMCKSPLSGSTLNRPSTKTIAVVDEENSGPPKPTEVPEGAPLNVEPCLLHMSKVEPSISTAQHEQVSVHRPQEYSFEEKRLAFMYHHYQSHVSAICR